jgi:hypothetical protein
MPFVILPTNSASGGYEITNSLRFNAGSSDELTRTFGTETSRRIFTFSFWIKKTNFSPSQGQSIFFGDTAGTTNATQDSFYFYLDKLYFGGWLSTIIISDMVFRDSSAWYHIVVAVDTTQATSSDRIKLYVNGTQQTYSTGGGYPAQNADFGITKSGNHSFFGNDGQSGRGNGYLAETYLIDGQQLTPSSFGETDSDTGIWKPKPYTGSYGNNGFYLQFKNSASLGTDSSGNGNNFTVTNLTSIDQTTDTPTNNWCTLNASDNIAYDGSGTLTQGNTNVSYTGGGFNTNATIAPNKGKWYWETKAVANARQGFVGMRISFQEVPNIYSSSNIVENASFGFYAHPTDGVVSVVNGSNVVRSSSLTYTNGDIIGIALDLDNNISYWYKNGSLTVTYDFSALSTIGTKNIVPAVGNGASSASPELNVNFGNPSLAGSSYADGAGYGNFGYAVPSGYYALNTKNLATFG